MACQVSACGSAATALLPLMPALRAMLVVCSSCHHRPMWLHPWWKSWALPELCAAASSLALPGILHPRVRLSQALGPAEGKMRAKSQLVAEGWPSPFSRDIRAKACKAKSCTDSGTVIYWELWLIFTCRFSHWDAQLRHNSRQGWAAPGKFIAPAERIHPSELKCLCMNQSWIFLPGWSFHLQGLTKQKESKRMRGMTKAPGHHLEGRRTPVWRLM